MDNTNIIVAQMQKDIEYIKCYLIDNKDDHARLGEKIDKLEESLDKRYAKKSVEKLMYMFITALCSAVAWLVIINP